MNIRSFLEKYVSFKSVSCDPSCSDNMRAIGDFLFSFFKTVGLNVRKIQTKKYDIIFAKNEHKAGRKTVLLYGHYDVQPAEEYGWFSDPFVLTERGGRLYARGASDNKGGNSTFLLALNDILSKNPDFPLNITVILEGEEEIGSPSMLNFLHEYRDELHSDFAIVADTSSIDDKNIIITTALRGLVGFELTLKSAQHDIHSGYGGTIINPIRELVKLCASFHNSNGLINIPGFYDDIENPSEFELLQTRTLPWQDEKFLLKLGAQKLSLDQEPYSAIDSMYFQPTLEFNGITGGYQEKGLKTIIPNQASVKITCRLVNNQDAYKIKELLEQVIRERVDKNIQICLEFEKASNPYNLLSNPDCFDVSTIIGYGLKVADQEIKNIFGKSPIYLRDGGSIALIRLLKDILSLDSILIGFSSPEDHIHDANESISIDMLNNGYLFFKTFLIRLATESG